MLTHKLSFLQTTFTKSRQFVIRLFRFFDLATLPPIDNSFQSKQFLVIRPKTLSETLPTNDLKFVLWRDCNLSIHMEQLVLELIHSTIFDIADRTPTDALFVLKDIATRELFYHHIVYGRTSELPLFVFHFENMSF